VEAPSSGVRRVDKVMPEAAAAEMLARAFSGRLATVGPEGWPYITPLLYVCREGEIWVHGPGVRGHLRVNVDHDARVCFEVDEPGAVFAYGRFECDTSVEYRSVVVFGRIRVVEDRDAKMRFFDALMAKYGDPAWQRPAGFYPRLEGITLYAIAVERINGKETVLPAVPQRWPAVDRTASPDARP
jgi:nitroimidazol reductase NimA-like FMN-containing flavoprotein (pyridoxamine 5'-phosphate oxidase superfamily)